MSDIYTLDWLREELNNQKSFNYTFFWQVSKDEEIGNSFLSQWYPSNFKSADGTSYNCAEQYMMAEKARLFGDEITRDKILNATNPYIMKKLGREVKNFDAEVWSKNCRHVVTNGNFLKFAQNEDLKKMLFNTGDNILVEASPYDSIWGIGLAENDINAVNPFNWKGTNYLGFCIMAVRDILQKKSLSFR